MAKGSRSCNWQYMEVCAMQSAEVVLSMLDQKSSQNSEFVFDRLYRNLFNPDFYMLAYSNIYAKEGNMTEGGDDSTMDGFNTTQVEQLIDLLKQETYSPKPVRRTYIPKKNGTLRPLGIPIRAVHYPSFQAMFGIPCVLLLVDRELRSTVITLLYHNFPNIASVSVLPLPFHGLAQSLDDLGRERNPAWPQRGGANALQEPRFAPVGDRRDIHVEQFGSGFSRIAPISPLPRWCGFRTLRTSSRNVIGIADPLDFADRQ